MRVGDPYRNRKDSNQVGDSKVSLNSTEIGLFEEQQQAKLKQSRFDKCNKVLKGFWSFVYLFINLYLLFNLILMIVALSKPPILYNINQGFTCTRSTCVIVSTKESACTFITKGTNYTDEYVSKF